MQGMNEMYDTGFTDGGGVIEGGDVAGGGEGGDVAGGGEGGFHGRWHECWILTNNESNS